VGGAGRGGGRSAQRNMAEPEPEAAAASAAAPAMKAGAMKALRAELEKVKAKWPDQITMKKGPKGDPWPVTVTRAIPQPKKAEEWDVFELYITLSIDHPDRELMLIHVDVPMESFPAKLKLLIADSIERKWKATLRDPRAAGKGWLIGMMFMGAEKDWLKLIGLQPEAIEKYQAVAEDGTTYMRKNIINPDEVGQEPTEEEKERMAAEEAAAEAIWIERKAQEEAKAEEEKALEGAKKRMEAEMGYFEDGEMQVKKLSKKEEQARLDAKRNKQGVRTAKTGSRRTKFDSTAKEENDKEMEKRKKERKEEKAKAREQEEQFGINKGSKKKT
jgi:hypothetical protein